MRTVSVSYTMHWSRVPSERHAVRDCCDVVVGRSPRSFRDCSKRPRRGSGFRNSERTVKKPAVVVICADVLTHLVCAQTSTCSNAIAALRPVAYWRLNETINPAYKLRHQIPHQGSACPETFWLYSGYETAECVKHTKGNRLA